MHFHAEHSLFFERPQPPWVAPLGIALAGSVLIVNAGAQSTALSLTGSGIGAVLLLVAHAHGRRRIKPALAWTLAVVALALLGGVALDANTEAPRLGSPGWRGRRVVPWPQRTRRSGGNSACRGHCRRRVLAARWTRARRARRQGRRDGLASRLNKAPNSTSQLDRRSNDSSVGLAGDTMTLASQEKTNAT